MAYKIYNREKLMEALKTGDIKWAVLGTGVIANEMAQALQKSGKRLYAVGNRTYSKAVSFAEKYGVDKAVGYHRHYCPQLPWLRNAELRYRRHRHHDRRRRYHTPGSSQGQVVLMLSIT